MRVTLTIESDVLGDGELTARTNSYTLDPDVAHGTLRALINEVIRKTGRAYELDHKEGP